MSAMSCSSSSDPGCLECLKSGGGPEMNTDISGPGVRISFYLQAYFLSLLSARSGSLEQITGALYTLVATNIAMVVTSFILGFKSKPGMSLHDAIIVFYLLSLSWASVFTSMPAYNRFVRSDTTLQIVSIVQSYLIFALVLAVLITAHTFGSTPLCNSHAVAVVFKQFPALDQGRIVALVFLSIIIAVYTFLTFTDYRRLVKSRYRSLKKWLAKTKTQTAGLNIHGTPGRASGPTPSDIDTSNNGNPRDVGDEEMNARRRKSERKDKRKAMKHKLGDKHNFLDFRAMSSMIPSRAYDAGVFGTLLIELIVITIIWAIFVMNSELLIVRNRFDGDGGTELWQFGQILPMLLVVLPLVNLIKVFRRLGITRRFHRRRVHRRSERREARRRAQQSANGGASRTPFEPAGGSNFFGRGWPNGSSFSPEPDVYDADVIGRHATAHISEVSIHPCAEDVNENSDSSDIMRRRSNFTALSSSPSPSSSGSSCI